MDFSAQSGREPRFQFPMRRKTLMLQRRKIVHNRKIAHVRMVTPGSQTFA